MMAGESAEARTVNASPVAKEARRFIGAAEALGTAPAATVLRVWCIPFLFESCEQIFSSSAEPVAAIRRIIGELATLLERIGTTRVPLLGNLSEAFRASRHLLRADVRIRTGEYYGHLFAAFSKTSFWDEPLLLLRERLDRNLLSVAELDKKAVLDAGCGGGRYTVAWRKLGARFVVGLDVSAVGVANAASRTRRAGLGGVAFELGDVLALPFPDSTFDVVFSNGVLHHSTDWAAGVFEAVRVLRPEGFGWLYLIESPGGLFADVIDLLRLALRNDSADAAQAALEQLGFPLNRIFYMLDHVKVPVNMRLTPAEVEDGLRRAGAHGIRRLHRGASFDRVERIARGDPYAVEKYGVGENRYVFTKA
jgi:SAM-dependent methyltransferase